VWEGAQSKEQENCHPRPTTPPWDEPMYFSAEIMLFDGPNVARVS
jgi:hypothetical protein